MSAADRKFDMELLFRALADRTRLRLLNLMGEGEVCVCHFVEILGTNQPKISRHLAYLRRAGVVVARRDGKWMHYRIVEPRSPHAARILADIREWLAGDTEMQKERGELANISCAPATPVRIQGAAQPVAILS